MASPVPLRDRAARREALLDAADRIVQRDGPAATMAVIAAEAGITKPVLYRHFGDKHGLYAALGDRYTSALLAQLQAALDAGSDRRDRVRRTVDAYLSAIQARPQVYRFLVLSDESPVASSQVRTFTRRLSEQLAEGMAAELGAAPLRAAVWAHGVVGMVQAAGEWWLDSPHVPREQVVDDLADLLSGAYAGA